MEAVIFCGIQATGKSTFYKERFFDTHVRISLDQLNTRYREGLILDACLRTSMRFVVDNTNPSKDDRQKYINLAKERQFKVVGYYFKSVLTDALTRNSLRSGTALIPEVGVKGTYKKLELPSVDEGFDELYYVSMDEHGFILKEWDNEI